MDNTTPTEERIYRCLHAVGVPRAHFAGLDANAVTMLLKARPEMVASYAHIGGVSVHDHALHQLAGRLLVVRGDHGATAGSVSDAGLADFGARECVLAGHEDVPWADTAAQRSGDLLSALLAFWRELDEAHPLAPFQPQQATGEVAGITFRAAGAGTPVVLLPLFLAASQWEPILADLRAHHAIIVLGGPELSPVSNIEWRAQTGYLRVVQGVLHEAALQGGERVLEVGCGTGAVVRWLSRYTNGRNPIDALDLSPFLLGVARELAEREGVGDSIAFHLGSAKALPFPDGHFDVAYSATMLEEVHADRALAEMVRVTRPGGRVAVVVRAIDLPAWTSLPLSAATRAKVENGEMGGLVGLNGCADASLSRRLTAAGLQHVSGYAQLGMVSPKMARWSQAEPAIRARLTLAEQEEWVTALTAAAVTGTPVWYGPPFHCALGTKPR